MMSSDPSGSMSVVGMGERWDRREPNFPTHYKMIISSAVSPHTSTLEHTRHLVERRNVYSRTFLKGHGFIDVS